MLTLVTRNFGEINVDDSKIINFNAGIPGFPGLTQFVLLSEPEDAAADNEGRDLFCWLQSVEDGNTSFCLVDMIKLIPDYNPLVAQEEVEDLGKYDPENFLILNFAVVPDDIKDMTVNLKAPVVINTTENLGKQVVCLNDEYSIRHYIFRKN